MGAIHWGQHSVQVFPHTSANAGTGSDSSIVQTLLALLCSIFRYSRVIDWNNLLLVLTTSTISCSPVGYRYPRPLWSPCPILLPCLPLEPRQQAFIQYGGQGAEETY